VADGAATLLERGGKRGWRGRTDDVLEAVNGAHDDCQSKRLVNSPIYLQIFELTVVVDGGIDVGTLNDVTVGGGEGGEAGNSEEGEAEHS
jgi:hypothetical protein